MIIRIKWEKLRDIVDVVARFKYYVWCGLIAQVFGELNECGIGLRARLLNDCNQDW